MELCAASKELELTAASIPGHTDTASFSIMHSKPSGKPTLCSSEDHWAAGCGGRRQIVGFYRVGAGFKT